MRYVILSVLVAMSVLAFGGVAEANHHQPLPATLAISPASPPANSVGELSGCGYIANENVRFTQTSAAGTAWFGNLADGSGCITIENWNGAAGSVTVDAEQLVCNNGGNCKYELMATLTYTIVP